jgi:Homeodomain-like domain
MIYKIIENCYDGQDCKAQDRRRQPAMPKKQYHVVLTKEQRDMLQELISSGKTRARTQTHARILLKADSGEAGPAWRDADIAEAVEVSVATVGKVRQCFFQAGGGQEGLEAALHRRMPNRIYTRKLDGVQEAHLVALTCSSPPDGQKRWTLRLLAAKMVELEYAGSVSLSHETVRQVLKKTGSSLG